MAFEYQLTGIAVQIYHTQCPVAGAESQLLPVRRECDRIELVLSGDAANESFLKLKGFDVEDLLNPVFEERVQNNTLIQPDF